MATPWYTSTDIIESVKRKINAPTDQSTLTDEDILKFANEEMRDSMIPNVMKYHEEFFVMSESLGFVQNKNVYPIPNRAIGMKLRDLMYSDGQPSAGMPYGNLCMMTRINPEDRAAFAWSSFGNNNKFPYYVENNNIIIPPPVNASVPGSLVFYYFMRPNQLVQNSRAHVVSSFVKTITVTNAAILPGDTVSFVYYTNETQENEIVLTAVSGTPSAYEFQIGISSTITATNLTQAINLYTEDLFLASNGNPASAVVQVTFLERSNQITTGSAGLIATTNRIGLAGDTTVPSNIVNGAYVDLLQTLPGHKIIDYDIRVPLTGVSANVLFLNESDVPPDFIIGDYVCARNECIIPFLPPELHSSLCERVASRFLAAQGDVEAYKLSSEKIDSLNNNENKLIDDRVDGSPLKVLNRNNLVRTCTSGSFWRRY